MNPARSGTLTRLLAATALVATLATAGAASADPLYWQVSYTDATTSTAFVLNITTNSVLDPNSTDTFVGNGRSDPGYDITNIYGTAGAQSVSGLPGNPFGIALNYGSAFGYDNFLFPNDPAIDSVGIVFLAADNTAYNLFSDGNGGFQQFASTDGNDTTTVNPDTVTLFSAVSAIPEPASLAFLALGVAGLGLVRRRSASKAA